MKLALFAVVVLEADNKWCDRVRSIRVSMYAGLIYKCLRLAIMVFDQTLFLEPKQKKKKVYEANF